MKAILVFTLFSLISFGALAQITYSVPVPHELEPYAVFPNMESEYVQNGDHLTVRYPLPLELVGATRDVITLSGHMTNPRHFRLRGDHADARCNDIGGKLSCTVEYKDLVIDEIAVRDAIVQKFPDPFEQDMRLQVARIFSGEPIGIITMALY